MSRRNIWSLFSLADHVSRERLLVIATIVGAVSGSVVAYISELTFKSQLASMQEQVDSAKGDSAKQSRALAIAEGNLAAQKAEVQVARAQADAAIGQVRGLAALVSAIQSSTSVAMRSSNLQLSLAAQQFAASQRARVAVTDVRLLSAIAARKQFAWFVRYENQGVEPAKSLRLVTMDGTRFSSNDLSSPGKFADYVHGVCKRQGLYKDLHELPHGGHMTIMSVPWDESFGKVLIGDGLFVATGCIEYKVESEFHTTSFCYYYTPKEDIGDHDLAQCPGGNESN